VEVIESGQIRLRCIEVWRKIVTVLMRYLALKRYDTVSTASTSADL